MQYIFIYKTTVELICVCIVSLVLMSNLSVETTLLWHVYVCMHLSSKCGIAMGFNLPTEIFVCISPNVKIIKENVFM